jgi:steroid 5-alpha reductase family enzyme
MSMPALLLAATLTVIASMTALWLFGIRRRNFSYVDVGWSANFVLIALLCGLGGGGAPGRRLLIGAMYGLWGLRLAWHLGRRIAGEAEEGRYLELRRKWGAAGEAALNRRMYRFYMVQAALDLVLSLPLIVVAQNPAEGIALLEWAALALWALALAGETLADAQLAAFKRSGAGHAAVCERGLWRYSRHPNYFFEWLIWVAYALAALASPPWGWLGLAMPALMLYFLLRVTGIPATEAQALRSKGDAYRAYQRRTSAFVPLPPRRG